MQLEAPVVEYLATGQLEHEVVRVATVVLYVPPTHAMHEELPVLPLYWPDGQLVQLAASVITE